MSYNKIIVLDLRNADIEIFNNWLSTTNYISSEPTKNLLKSYINNGTENAVAMVYMIDNFPLADCKKSNLLKIDFDEYSFNELQNLIPIQLKDIEIYRSVIIDWIFNANTEKTKIAQELWEFQNYDNLDDLLYAPFVRNVMAIDVKELGFRLREFFVPLHQKFKAIHQFFSTTYKVKQLLDKVHLTRIFVMDEYIIGYNFQLEGENQEHFFVNIHLEEQLLCLEPFTFQDTRILTVDTLLEKIFANGIKSLTPKEKDFLDNSKNLNYEN